MARQLTKISLDPEEAFANFRRGLKTALSVSKPELKSRLQEYEASRAGKVRPGPRRGVKASDRASSIAP
jgi:hypothetical protein